MVDNEEHLCGGCMETFDDLDERKQHRLDEHPDECQPTRFCFCVFCGKQQHSDFAAYDHLLEAHTPQWNEMVSRMMKVSRIKEHHFQERWALAGAACLDIPRKATLKIVLKNIDDFWTFPMDKENNEPPSTSRGQAVPAASELNDECLANEDDLQEVRASRLEECSNKQKDHQSPAIQSTASPLIEPSSSEISDEEEQVPSTSADQPREESEPVRQASVITRAENIADSPTRKRATSDVPSAQGPSTSVLEGILKKPRTEPPTTSSLPPQVVRASLTSAGVTMPVLIPKEMIRFHENGIPYIDMSRHQNAGPKKYAFLPEESLRKEQTHQQHQASSHSSSIEPGPSQQQIRSNLGSSDSPSTSSGSASGGSSHQHSNHPNTSRSSASNAPTLQSILDAPVNQPPLNEDMPLSSNALSKGFNPTASTAPQPASSSVDSVSPTDPDFVFWTGKDASGQCPRCSYCTTGAPQTKRVHFVKCHYNIYYDKVRRAESDLETFMSISLGHELSYRQRKCLHCTLSNNNYPDRKALLEHHLVSHPSEFLAFRNRFEQIQQKTGEVVDGGILDLIQTSYLIQT